MRRTSNASVVTGILSLILTSYRPTTNSLCMSTSPQRLLWLHFAFLSYLNGLYHAPGSRSNFPRLALPIFLNDAFEAGGGERASGPRSPALTPVGAYGQHGPVIRSRNAGCGRRERDGRVIFLLELPFQNLNGNVGYYSSSFGRWMLRREGEG